MLRARRAYFANVSYIDDKIGEILSVLGDCRMAGNTIVVFCADHGDMLGERGLWFKMSFFEGSSRVPLMLHVPDIDGRLIEAPVSLLDVVPTLADLAGVDLAEVAPWTDGESLLPLAHGAERSAPVLMEYAAEGSIAPLVSVRDGDWKFNHCEADPPQLFDLRNDPRELANRAADPACEERVARFMKDVEQRWDLVRFDAEIRESQARRHVVYEALREGAHYPWDFQPLQKASERGFVSTTCAIIST